MSPTPGSTGTETWSAAWESALDELELTLEETEHLLQGEHPDPTSTQTGWTPPVLPGPLPAELADRARELLARQQDLLLRTAQAATSARANANFVGRLADTRPSVRSPIYVDVSA
ncbi:MAG: hypothetical protein WBQ50_11130 [Nocardioides sp.]